jgi:hypothetical protein
MLRKKNYERGFVRRVKGSIFSSDSSSANRANKKKSKSKFSRLDGYDDYEGDESLINVVSADSGETNTKVQEVKLNGFDMAPFEDVVSPGKKRKSDAYDEKKKKRRNEELLGSPDPHFPSGSFNFESISDIPFKNHKVEEVVSEKKAEDDSEWTSLPSNGFFSTSVSSWAEKSFNPFGRSKKNNSGASELTEGNLKALAFSEDDIENINSRRDFVQFTIDEDKASTVILASGNSFEDEENNENSDDDSDVQLNDFGFKIGEEKKPQNIGGFLRAKIKDTTPIHGTGHSFDFKSEQKEEQTSMKESNFASFESAFEMETEWGVPKSKPIVLPSKPNNRQCHQPLTAPSTTAFPKPPVPVASKGKAQNFSLSTNVSQIRPDITKDEQSEGWPMNVSNNFEGALSSDFKNPTDAFAPEVPRTNVKRVPLSPLYQDKDQKDFKSNLEFFRSINSENKRRSSLEKTSTRKEADDQVAGVFDAGLKKDAIQKQVTRSSEDESNMQEKRTQNCAGILSTPSFDSYSDSEDGGDYYFTPAALAQKENLHIGKRGSLGNHPSESVSQNASALSIGKTARLGTYVESSNLGVRDRSHNMTLTKQDRPKPIMGLPNNAIAASMLFRTSYNIDKEEVDAKLKAKAEENSSFRRGPRQGNVPHSIAANDTVSVVSSFSDETAMLDPWRKRSQTLLNYIHANNKPSLAKPEESLYEA